MEAQGYFPEKSKYLFMVEFPAQEKMAQCELKAEGLTIKFVLGRWYLVAYMVSREELEE